MDKFLHKQCVRVMLNEPVSIPDNGAIASNGKAVVEYLAGEDAERRCGGLTEVFLRSSSLVCRG